MSKNKSTNRFQINFPNVIGLLGRSLYPDKEAAIREIIQNATDGIVRREAEDSEEFAGKIIVEIVPSENRVSITDNGIGMDIDDIRNMLGTVGRSGTDEFRQALVKSDVKSAKDLIGQFGIGFLSAFLIADKLVISSKRWGQNSKVAVFSSDGDSTYEVREIDDEQSYGTTVSMHLASHSRNLLDVSEIARLIRKYSNFIKTPIYIAGIPSPVNAMDAPWYRKSSEKDYLKFVEDYDKDALAIFAIDSPNVSGVLYIPSVGPRSYPSGNIILYVRRMYIHTSDQYLPEGLRFMKGFIECPNLQLTTSRSEVIHNLDFAEVQTEISNTIYEKLGQFIKLGGENAKVFLSQYDGLLKAESLRDDTLFDKVYEHILLPCGWKLLSVSDCLKVTAATSTYDSQCLFYYAENNYEQKAYIQSIVYLTGIPVIDASLPINRLFLEKLSDSPRNITCHQLKVDILKFMQSTFYRIPENKPQFLDKSTLSATRSDSKYTLFVMMPFAERLRWVFDDVVVPVGNELGIHVSRLDEDAFVGRITEKMESMIASSDILLADITEFNANVMYELGLAHGMLRKRRTILVGQDVSKIPFDIHDYVVIDYGTSQSAIRFKDRLRSSITIILNELESEQK